MTLIKHLIGIIGVLLLMTTVVASWLRLHSQSSSMILALLSIGIMLVLISIIWKRDK